MKKSFFLLIGLLSMLNIYAYDAANLYLVGNATLATWDPDKALEMEQVETNVFTWTGVLMDNTNDARFKFLVVRDWNPSITCQITTPGHQIINPGEDYDLYEQTGGEDNAFQVTKTGIYTVNVNLNTLKMSIEFTDLPLPESLRIIGNAIDTEWDLGSAPEMTEIAEGIFLWRGALYSTGEFKFITEHGWNNTLNAVDGDKELETGKRYALSYRLLESDFGDSKFKVTESGNYMIVVDFNAMKLKFMPYNYEQLYIAGSATNPDGQWSVEEAGCIFEMTKTTDNQFEWTGQLYHTNNGTENLDPGQFKFLTSVDWGASIAYNEEASENIAVEMETDYILSAHTGYRDNKFIVTESDEYKVRVDLNTMKMQIAKSTGIQPIQANADLFKTADRIQILDMTGKCIFTESNISRTLPLENQLPSGFYIVRFESQGVAYSKKRIVVR
ncbi:MAG: SusF/SusE family outer membrane protein [Candidatus Symbiothrix sp.]|jgi:hypothetical protein|nr:SusF/SusE family outer membrane protein [Candidatus Symbiothrix sp.]